MNKIKNFTGRFTVAIFAAIITLAAAVCVSAEEYNTKIMNSSFETPNFYDVKKDYWYELVPSGGTGNNISLNSGAAYLVTSKNKFEQITGNQFYWNTTAYNNRMEIATAVDEYGWGESNNLSSYFGYDSSVNRSAAHGSQFAELVAEEESSLYQTISTEPGATLTWSLAHRARYHRDNPQKTTDSMALFIGPEQSGLKKRSSTANDIFKQMALLLYANFDNMEMGMANRAVKLYSAAITDGMTIDESCVSAVKTENCDQEWLCWIITSDNKDWYRYSDTYKVPAGQNTTTLAFTALNSESDGSVSYVNEGNLLDDIQLSVMHQLTVSTNEGGQGVVSYTNEGITQNDSVEIETSPYIRNFEEGTEVTISAMPDEGYVLVGAMVDGEVISASDFTSNNNGSYKLVMNSEHSVSLYFAKKAYVIYDPNKGSFSGVGNPLVNESGQSEYSINTALSLTQSAVPVNGNKVFVGWRVFSDGDRTADMGVFIPAIHQISYDQTDSTFTIIYNGSTKLTVPTNNNTILFVAEYRNILSVQSCYVGVDKEVVHDDWAGGTASIQLEGSDDTSTSIGIYSGQRYTVTAEPKPGYEFKGWYYTFDDSDDKTVYVIPSTDKTYSGIYSFNENITIHAQFVEIAVAPILNVIAEDEEAETELVSKGIVSTDENYTHGYGGSEYGNTIATSFHITRDFTGTTTMPGGVWTIYLPVNGTYMKVPETDNRNDYDHVDFNRQVVKDNTNTGKSNYGTIYDMKSSDDARTEKFSVYVGGHSNLTLTDATVVFGIVIDNVYAPNATAGFKVESEKPTDVPELNDDNSIYTHYKEDGKYEHDESKLDGEVVSE